MNRTFTANWNIPANEATGAYSVRVGMFGPNWNPFQHWNASAGTLTVTRCPRRRPLDHVDHDDDATVDTTGGADDEHVIDDHDNSGADHEHVIDHHDDVLDDYDNGGADHDDHDDAADDHDDGSDGRRPCSRRTGSTGWARRRSRRASTCRG